MVRRGEPREAALFDGPFYQQVLPDAVRQQCQDQSGHVPVVQLHLGDGATLDLCHVVSLAPTWFAVAYFRDPAVGEEVEQALLPYPMVEWITLSFHPPHVRRIGFDVEQSAAATRIEPIAPLQVASAAGAAQSLNVEPAVPPATLGDGHMAGR
jgi:hypothetical protein